MTDVSSSEESSAEEDIVTIALTNEEPLLPPPPMCLMAKSNTKVCDEDSDSDDELDPNEFANLINEYTSVIKRDKGKVKRLESTHAKLELAHSDLLGKYNDFLKSTMSHLHLLSKLKRITKSSSKNIGSWLTNIKSLSLPMKQLTRVLRTLSMKILKRSMLLLHVMTYSLMQMLLMFCPSLLPLGKRN